MMRSIILAAASALVALTPSAHAKDHPADHGQTGMAPMEIRASIADGAVLNTRPARIDLTFKPAMRLAAARLSTATGETISVRFDAQAPAGTAATVQFAPLAPDSYVFAFSADAGDHLMPGRIRFTVR
jgi:methionine-rich copper-binding protein CopC